MIYVCGQRLIRRFNGLYGMTTSTSKNCRVSTYFFQVRCVKDLVGDKLSPSIRLRKGMMPRLAAFDCAIRNSLNPT